MALTYVNISSQILSSTPTSVTFSSIPATYTDLVLLASVRTNTTNTQDYLVVQFNNATTQYTATYIWSTGANQGSSNVTQIYGPVNGNGATANIYGSFEMYLPFYTGGVNKPLLIHSAQENNTSNAEQYLTAGFWSNTSAINSIKLQPYYNQGTTVFQVGTSFYLYGIKNS